MRRLENRAGRRLCPFDVVAGDLDLGAGPLAAGANCPACSDICDLSSVLTTPCS